MVHCIKRESFKPNLKQRGCLPPKHKLVQQNWSRIAEALPPSKLLQALGTTGKPAQVSLNFQNKFISYIFKNVYAINKTSSSNSERRI